MGSAPASNAGFRTFVLVGVAVFGCFVGAQAQNKADLQKERDAIQAKIATTEKLLNQTASNKKDALVQLRLVNERMSLREQLIQHHQAEIRALERSMTNTDSEIRSLEGHIAAMKDEYARMIQAAYKHSLGHNPWMYVFAAEDFAQAVIRFQLLQSYSSLRKEQVQQIQGSQLELAENRLSLEAKRAELEKVIADVRSCLLYTSPSPRDYAASRMPSSA